MSCVSARLAVAAALCLAVAAGNVAGAATKTKLTISPSVAQGQIDNVTLSWSDLDTSSSDEFSIGVYVNEPTLSHVANIAIPTDNASGQVTVPVLNIRRGYYFILCGSSSCSPSKYIARSDQNLTFKSYDDPQNVRVALTNQEDEVTVTFRTKTSLTNPTVMVGTSPDALSKSYTGISREPYTIDDMCFSPASDPAYFFDTGYQHAVNITMPSGKRTAYYKVGGTLPSGDQVWSDVRSLILPPATAQATSIAVYGDMGVHLPYDAYSSLPPAKDTIELVKLMIDEKFDPSLPPITSVLHIGDISYGRGHPFIWEWFLNSIEPVSSKLPYMVGIGNHEYDYCGYGQDCPSWTDYGLDSGGECGVVYSTLFDMPEPSSNPPPSTGRKNTRNLWYSFDNGPIHFVVMSTEHDFEEGSPQYKFIVDDLSSVNRTRTPWLVFSGHRPMYSTVYSPQVELNVRMQNAYEPLFAKYGVDVALWGHVHKYERTCAISRNGTCADASKKEHGTVHVVIGNAGNDYQVPWYSSSSAHYPPPDWLIFRTFSFGVSRITANKTSLYFTSLGWRSHTVQDEFTLYK